MTCSYFLFARNHLASSLDGLCQGCRRRRFSGLREFITGGHCGSLHGYRAKGYWGDGGNVRWTVRTEYWYFRCLDCRCSKSVQSAELLRPWWFDWGLDVQHYQPTLSRDNGYTCTTLFEVMATSNPNHTSVAKWTSKIQALLKIVLCLVFIWVVLSHGLPDTVC
jgi:hypothetical protein